MNHLGKSVLCMDERKNVEIMAVVSIYLLGTGLFVDSFSDEESVPWQGGAVGSRARFRGDMNRISNPADHRPLRTGPRYARA